MTSSTPFSPAIPLTINWKVGDSQYGDTEKDPKYISLQIPVDSVHDFCQHLMNLADNKENYKEGKTWDNINKEAKTVNCITIAGKGKDGEWGPFGRINPTKVELGDSDAF